MFKIQEIREIIKLIDQSSIQEFKIELEGTKIAIKKNAGVAELAMPQFVAQPVAPVVTAPVVAQASVVEVQPTAPQVAKAPEVTPAQAPAADDANLHKIVSPMVGTFYRSSEPGKPAFVQPGDKVTASKVVCIVEAMKLFNEIEAEVSGEIVKVLVEDGQLVEYGQPLFLVKPE